MVSVLRAEQEEKNAGWRFLSGLAGGREGDGEAPRTAPPGEREGFSSSFFFFGLFSRATCNIWKFFSG